MHGNLDSMGKCKSVKSDKNGMQMAGTGTHIDGQSRSQTVTYEFRSQDESVTRTSDRKRGEETLAKEAPIVFRRIK